jgi:hypothetical protein
MEAKVEGMSKLFLIQDVHALFFRRVVLFAAQENELGFVGPENQSICVPKFKNVAHGPWANQALCAYWLRCLRLSLADQILYLQR